MKLQQDAGAGASSQVPDDHLVQQEERQIDVAIQHLPEELRTVLVMRTCGEMTSAEVGVAFDKRAGTIRYLSRLQQKVQEIGNNLLDFLHFGFHNPRSPHMNCPELYPLG